MSSKKITDFNQMKLAALRGKADTASKVSELAQVVTEAVSELENTKQDIPTVQTIVLAAGSWDANGKTQNVSVAGVLADQTKQIVTVTPAVEDRVTCGEHGIDVSAVADGSITFSAFAIPADDVTVYVSIQSAKTA